jgi:DNA (cytosine-5)-methyltransferase 1
VTQLRLLDLFCGAGGAGKGYQLAGFAVTGVDNAPQPDYPATFIHGDAVEYLEAHGHEYDAIHASPPCQSSSLITKGTNKGRVYPNHIPATRELLSRLEVPSVMENVQGSDLRPDLNLCGEMFGLGVIRHRYFELENWTAEQPEHLPHRGRVAGFRHGEWFEGPYFAVYGKGGGKGTVAQWQKAMGMDWTKVRKSIAEAIPPAYTEYIGQQLMSHLLLTQELDSILSSCPKENQTV